MSKGSKVATQDAIKKHVDERRNHGNRSNKPKVAKPRKPVDIESLNRDLVRTPVELKGRHLKTGDYPTASIGSEWLSTRAWSVKLSVLKIGSLLTHDWLRVKELGIVDAGRNLLLSALFGLKEGGVSFQVTKAPFNVPKAGARGTLVRYKRTKGSFAEDWGVYVVFKSDSRHFVAIDSRWVELFGLTCVWKSIDEPSGPLLNHFDPAKATVIIGASPTVPEEASYTAFNLADLEQ